MKKRGKTVTPREAIRLLTKTLGRGHQNGEWVNFNCPFRHEKNGVNKPDRKRRLGINLKTGWYHCHRCGRKGLVASEFGVSIKGAVPRRKTSDKDYLDDPGHRGVMPPFKTLPAPDQAPSTLARPVLAYLATRGIDALTGHVLDIGYGTAPGWQNASIHPYYDDDNETLRGWQARYITPGATPKVRTAQKKDWPGAWGASDGALYMLECVQNDGWVMLTEGPFDALSVSRVMPAVASLGSVLHEAQAVRLRDRAQGVVVGYDPDKPKTSRAACKMLRRVGVKNIRLIVWPERWPAGVDWGDLNIEDVRRALVAFGRDYGIGSGF
jgi:hypothetical protein